MRVNCSLLCIAVILAFEVVAQAAPFVVFPKADQLRSPDGRFVVRNIDREALSEYVGAFHSLFLDETASGLSRQLCDYVGVAAVAWAKNDSIIVAQYVSKQTSRALVFAASDSRGPVVIDKSSLTRLVPADLRPPLWRHRASSGKHSHSAFGDMGSTTPKAFAGSASTACSRAGFPARKRPSLTSD
jgi:hypothetical protein